MHVGVATRVELVIAYIVPGESEGNRSGLSHLATGEGNHNGLSHSCINAASFLPQSLVSLLHPRHGGLLLMHGWVGGHKKNPGQYVNAYTFE